ncbi:MAG: N-acetylmuramoyl-L-alanine amidase [Ignavibacteria bacterium]|nr:N-acetylmuramoyl-L-alanine amidase [Ignavibacteria bacterium]
MKINKVTIHITASEGTVESIRRAHKAQGWKDIGYHWLVDKEGVIHAGRPESQVGAHVGGHNSGNIGIAYISRGSDTQSDAPYGKYMTLAQKNSLEWITAQVLYRYDLSTDDIYGHNDFPGVAKACPCFKVRKAADFLNSVQEKLNWEKSAINPKPELAEQAEAVDGEDGEPETDEELQAHSAGKEVTE